MLFLFFKLAGIVPNIMLIFVVSFALMRGQTEGMLIGFCSGMLLDIMAGNAIGFNALLYLFMGYANGLLARIFYANNILMPLAMIFVNSMAYNFIIYICQFLLRNRTNLGFYMMHVLLPEVIYTFLIAIFLYNVFLWLNQILEKSEKGVSA